MGRRVNIDMFPVGDGGPKAFGEICRNCSHLRDCDMIVVNRDGNVAIVPMAEEEDEEQSSRCYEFEAMRELLFPGHEYKCESFNRGTE